MRARNAAAASVAVLALAGCGSAAAGHSPTSPPAHAVDTAANSMAMTAACRSYLRNAGTIFVAGSVAPVQVGKLLGTLEVIANQGSSGPDRNAVAKAFGAASLDYYLNGASAHRVRDLTVIASTCHNVAH